MIRLSSFLVAFACFLALSFGEVIVYTQYGPIQGVINDDSFSFLGIPFAQPPVGNLRLEKPQPPSSWGPLPLQATAFQAGCPQYCSLPPFVCPANTSEDCLTLNVYTPLEDSASLIPVMVFFPGGRFEEGAASTELYNSQFLANTSQVIVVTVNYRLGALGFLVAKDDFSILSNLGFLDQQLALQWVQDNIDAFGGDPDRVTIFGQSAGATSTSIHMTTPTSFGYFDKAIIESDPAGLLIPTLEQADKLSKRFREHVGCKGDKNVNELKECLQNKTIDEILNAQAAAEDHLNLFAPLGMFMPWAPVVDNLIILEQPLVAFYGGHFKPVPLMIGTVLDEATMFVDEIFPNGLPAYEYEAILIDVLRRHDKFEEATVLYPPVLDSKNLTGQRLSNLTTDYLFVCASRNVTRSIINNLSPSQAEQVFLYRFEHVPSFYEAWGPNYTFCDFTVCHGAELPFVFHSAGMVTPPYNYTAEELVLSQQMSNYWGNFAHSGSPNTGPSSVSLEWPVYQNGRLNAWENIVFNTPSTIQKNADNVHCNFWDTVGYLLP